MKATLISLILTSTLLCGCGDGRPDAPRENRLAVSTITIIADVARQIAGDRIEVVSIMKPGGDPHLYQPVPGDARLIARSDIVLMNGLTLEGWIEELVKNAGGERPVIRVTEGIPYLRDPLRHGEPDPHCWFNVLNMKTYVKNIVQGLITLDPEGADFYHARADAYTDVLDSLHRWVLETVDRVPPERRVLVTSHDAFRYFGEAYGFEVIGLQGISTESRAQTEDVARVIDVIRKRKLPAVFIETSVNPKMLQQIAGETDATIGGVLYSDSLGPPGTPEETYVGTVRHNVGTIVSALTGPLTAQRR